MRIITGKARGIKLNTLAGDETRPTAERVKEAIFSMLQFDIEGREVLDLFAGSGQMGLEAVSRGAANAVFVDKSKNAIKIIEDNVTKTRLGECCFVKNMDSIDYLKRNKGKKFDIIFVDPPYASGLYVTVFKELFSSQMLKPASLIVCESDCDFWSTDEYLKQYYSIKKMSKYGKTVITVLAPIIESE